MSELIYQSEHTGTKIDEAVSKVPKLEQSINDLDEFKDSHNTDATAHEDIRQSINDLVAVFTNVNIATTDFVADITYPYFKYKAIITCNGITADYIAEVIFNVDDAMSGNYAPVTLTGVNTVTIYAVEVPTSAIIIPTIKCTKAVD